MIADKIKSIPFWYHKIDLGECLTPGAHPISVDAYKVPADLTGKRVLDVGSWDGFWAFEALKRGAREVVAIDDFSDMPWMDKNNRTAWDSFDLCKEALGYGDECQRISMSLYDIKKLGKFDIVFFFGVLYHCRYPLLALDMMSSVCDEAIYLETQVSNAFSPYNGVGHDDRIVMEFYPGNQLGQVGTNWWAPTTNCLWLMLESAGFINVDVWKIKDPPDGEICLHRAFAKGYKL